MSKGYINIKHKLPRSTCDRQLSDTCLRRVARSLLGPARRPARPRYGQVRLASPVTRMFSAGPVSVICGRRCSMAVT